MATIAAGTGLVIAPPAGAAPPADADGLRAAVTNLTGTGPAAEIELKSGVTYSLPGKGGCADEDDNEAGDLDIRREQPLKIFTPDGQAPAVVEMTCDAKSSPQRVIHVLPAPNSRTTGKLTLRNVVIRNGHAPSSPGSRNLGGGVLAFGDIAAENAVFETNAAGDGQDGDADSPDGETGGFGGAFAAAGVVTIDGSTFTGNRAGAGGNGLSRKDEVCSGQDGGRGGPGGQAGAVLAVRGLTITNSTFSGNRSGDGGKGGDGACGNADHREGGNGGDGGPSGSGGALQCGSIVPGRKSLPLLCTGSMVVRASTMAGNTTGDGGDGGNGGTGDSTAKGGNGGRGGAFEANGFGGAIVFIGGTAKGGGVVDRAVLDRTVVGRAVLDGAVMNRADIDRPVAGGPILDGPALGGAAEDRAAEDGAAQDGAANDVSATLLVENSTLDGNSSGAGGAGGNGGTGARARPTPSCPTRPLPQR